MPVRFLLIAGAFLISVLMWVDRACISAAKDDIAADLGFSDQQMGWVMAAFTLGYAFFQVPGGAIADRFGPRVSMTIVCLAWSIFTALTGAVRGLYFMVATRFLFGVGEAGGYPTLTRAFTSWLPIGERGITNSISFSGGRLGAALAMPTVVGLIATLGGWQQAFYLFGGVGLAIALAWFALFRDTPESHFAVSDAERDHILATRSAKPSGGEDTRPRIGVGDIVTSPNMLMLMVQYVAHNVTFFFTVSWFFPYLKDTYELTNSQTAWYAAAPLLCGVVGNWLAGFTVDALYRKGKWRLSRRLPAITGFVFGAVGMSLCVNMTTPLSAVVCMCIAIFGADMILSPSWSTCMDIGGRDAGKVSGSMNMIGNLGSFGTALSFPYLYDWTGSHERFFYIAAGLNVVAILMWVFIRPDVPVGSERQTETEDE